MFAIFLKIALTAFIIMVVTHIYVHSPTTEKENWHEMDKTEKVLEIVALIIFITCLVGTIGAVWTFLPPYR